MGNSKMRNPADPAAVAVLVGPCRPGRCRLSGNVDRMEAMALSGDRIYDDYLANRQPIRFEAYEEGERFRVVITSSNRKTKRTLRYRVTGPGGYR